MASFQVLKSRSLPSDKAFDKLNSFLSQVHAQQNVLTNNGVNSTSTTTNGMSEQESSIAQINIENAHTKKNYNVLGADVLYQLSLIRDALQMENKQGQLVKTETTRMKDEDSE